MDRVTPAQHAAFFAALGKSSVLPEELALTVWMKRAVSKMSTAEWRKLARAQDLDDDLNREASVVALYNKLMCAPSKGRRSAA